MALAYCNLTKSLRCIYYLDDIPGIGPKRLKAIWQAFGSLEELAGEEAKEIADKAKLPLGVAERVRKRAQEVGGGK